MFLPVLLCSAPSSNCGSLDDPADADLLIEAAAEWDIAEGLTRCVVEEMPGTSLLEFMVNAA